jgi:hypothetical protein
MMNGRQPRPSTAGATRSTGHPLSSSNNSNSSGAETGDTPSKARPNSAAPTRSPPSASRPLSARNSRKYSLSATSTTTTTAGGGNSHSGSSGGAALRGSTMTKQQELAKSPYMIPRAGSQKLWVGGGGSRPRNAPAPSPRTPREPSPRAAASPRAKQQAREEAPPKPPRITRTKKPWDA